MKNVLNLKWWYRLLKVIFIIAAVVIVCTSFLFFCNYDDYYIPQWRVAIKYNLYEYAAGKQDKGSDTSVEKFFDLPGLDGCLDKDKGSVTNISYDEVRHIKSNILCIPEVPSGLSADQLDMDKYKFTSVDISLNGEVVCVATKDYNSCRSDRIVKYDYNRLHYVALICGAVGSSLLVLFGVLFVGWLLKFVMVYVVYGFNSSDSEL